MADFVNNKLVSSCMAFIEMLSRDSTHMRIDSLAANRIYMYLINKESKDKADESNANRDDRNILKKIGNYKLYRHVVDTCSAYGIVFQ